MSARLLPLLLIALLALPARAQDADVYRVVDDPPELIGGLEGLQQEVRYPEAARAAGVEGTVFVQFVVDENGRVTDERVIRSVSPELDAEALRVIRQARFEPGTQRGEPVKVRFTIPIQYRLGSSNQSER
jgi:TonB family protein